MSVERAKDSATDFDSFSDLEYLSLVHKIDNNDAGDSNLTIFSEQKWDPWDVLGLDYDMLGEIVYLQREVTAHVNNYMDGSAPGVVEVEGALGVNMSGDEWSVNGNDYESRTADDGTDYSIAYGAAEQPAELDVFHASSQEGFASFSDGNAAGSSPTTIERTVNFRDLSNGTGPVLDGNDDLVTFIEMDGNQVAQGHKVLTHYRLAINPIEIEGGRRSFGLPVSGD